jgi:hypothetical protein
VGEIVSEYFVRAAVAERVDVVKPFDQDAHTGGRFVKLDFANKGATGQLTGVTTRFSSSPAGG